MTGSSPDFETLLWVLAQHHVDRRQSSCAQRLEALVKIKEELGHEKDKTVLTILRRTLRSSKATSIRRFERFADRQIPG